MSDHDESESTTDPPAVQTPDELRRQQEAEESGEGLVFLSQHRRGAFALEFARALKALVTAVRKQQKAGSLTVKIEVKPIKGAMAGSVTVLDTVTVKAPTGDRPASTMFTTPDGWLTRDHPDQYAAFQVQNQQPGGHQ